MTHATQLDRIAALVEHDLGPGSSVTCSLDTSTGSTILVFRSKSAALAVHLSTQCTANFRRLNDEDAKARLRQMFDDFSG